MKEIGGVLGKGMGEEVVKRLGGLVEGREGGEGGERVFYFSSHDTAIAPLLSLLGLLIQLFIYICIFLLLFYFLTLLSFHQGVRGFPVPKTGCYLLFELHFLPENDQENKKEEKKGQYFVKTICNFDPIGEGDEGERGVQVMGVGEMGRMTKEGGVGAEAVVTWEEFKRRVGSFF